MSDRQTKRDTPGNDRMASVGTGLKAGLEQPRDTDRDQVAPKPGSEYAKRLNYLLRQDQRHQERLRELKAYAGWQQKIESIVKAPKEIEIGKIPNFKPKVMVLCEVCEKMKHPLTICYSRFCIEERRAETKIR